MSAKDRLWELYQTPDSASAFGEALDDFAYELAEKIRAHRDHTRGAVQATKVMDFAADLIDPHARHAAEVVNPRDELWDTLGIDPDRISREEFEEYLDAYDRAVSAGPVRPGEEPTV